MWRLQYPHFGGHGRCRANHTITWIFWTRRYPLVRAPSTHNKPWTIFQQAPSPSEIGRHSFFTVDGSIAMDEKETCLGSALEKDRFRASVTWKSAKDPGLCRRATARWRSDHRGWCSLTIPLLPLGDYSSMRLTLWTDYLWYTQSTLLRRVMEDSHAAFRFPVCTWEGCASRSPRP